MTRDYELGFILNPEVSEEETRAIMARIEQIIAAHDGQIVRVQQWGRRRLAYPIQHHRDGFYVFIDMILTPETVSELERTLKVSEIVLRYMTRRRDPKAVQQEREARANAEAATPVAVAPTSDVNEEQVQPGTEEQPEQGAEESEQAQPVAEQPAVEPGEPVEVDDEDVPAATETIEA